MCSKLQEEKWKTKIGLGLQFFLPASNVMIRTVSLLLMAGVVLMLFPQNLSPVFDYYQLIIGRLHVNSCYPSLLGPNSNVII